MSMSKEASRAKRALGVSILFVIFYLLVFLAMFVGRRHFRKKGVEA